MAQRRSDQVRVGIIGAGLIGNAHSMMIRMVGDRTNKSVRVAAVADPDRAAADTLALRWPNSRAHSDARAVIEDPDIDAVWICTPTAMHRDIAIAAARAGKHLFCEKPLAMSADDASAMYRAIAEAGVLSQVGLVMRFSPVYTVARAMIREPDAGRTLAATMRDDQDFPIRGAHNSLWRNDPAMTAGGTMVEHSVHDIDLFTWMFGEPRRVYCRTRNLAGAAGIEDVAITALEFDDGLTAQVTSVWHRMIARASNRRFESFSENLVVASEHDGLGPIVVQRGDDAHESVIPAAEVLALFKTIILDERPYLRAIDDCLEIAYAIEDAIFIAAIRGECDPYPAFADGVAVQRVVERAYESARRGVPVSIESKVIL